MIVAVVPLNRLNVAKSRLAESDADRPTLVWDMLANVVGALVGCPAIAEVAVVTPEESLEPAIARLGASFLPDPQSGLLDALEVGRAWAEHRKASGLLVVLGDLPWLTSEEITDLLARSPRLGAVLAPDRERSGTNALFTRPVGAMPFRFGVNSFAKHLDQARSLGLEVEIFQSPGTESDIDLPGHLEELTWRTKSAIRPVV
jgi:2-phospho-L-lactate guanylyltransferase